MYQEVLPAESLKLKWLGTQIQDLTVWEKKFVETTKGKQTLSSAQRAKVSEIYKKIRHGERDFFFNEFQGLTRNQLADAWDSVHDFDR